MSVDNFLFSQLFIKLFFYCFQGITFDFSCRKSHEKDNLDSAAAHDPITNSDLSSHPEDLGGCFRFSILLQLCSFGSKHKLFSMVLSNEYTDIALQTKFTSLLLIHFFLIVI